MKKLKFLAAALLMGAAAMALAGCGKKTEVEMTDYLIISFSGVEGEGSAKVSFDDISMEQDIFSAIAEEKDLDSLEDVKDEVEGLKNLPDFEDSIICKLNKEAGLENGDKVTVSISYDKSLAKECQLKITGDTKKTFKVDGLKERKEVDAFDSKYFNQEEGIDLSFSGISPFGHLSIENHVDESNPLSRVHYEASKEEDIKKGDTITITASLPETFAEEGWVLKESSVTVTAENLRSYISELKPGMWEQIEPYCDAEITDELNDVFYIMDGSELYRFTENEVISFEGVVYGPDAYLATNHLEKDMNSYNILIVPYSIHAVLEDDIRLGENTTATGYIIVRNLVDAGNGDVDLDSIKIGLPDFSYTTIEQADSDVLDDFKVNYDLVSIPLQ